MSTADLTPEQARQIELNRLRAKARIREASRASRSTPSASAPKTPSGKRKLIPADSTSPTGPSSSSRIPTRRNAAAQAAEDELRPLPRDPRLGTYYEYDLSKMVNSKGGFLVEDDPGEGAKTAEEVRREKEREMERMKASYEPGLIDRSTNPQCESCGTIEIDPQFHKVFGCRVCAKCKNEQPEKYSLLTKTECKEDYLLTDPELNDAESLPHLLKANPHKATWNNMMLFLRLQVEAFAFKKWGGPEGLDAEWARREEQKQLKRGRKFEERLRDLRRRTTGRNVWQRRRDEEHQHEWEEVGGGRTRCEGCGLVVEAEEL